MIPETKLLQRLMGRMAEELRGTLQAISGQTEIMYEANQTASDRLRCLGHIRRNVKTLSELAEDLASLSEKDSTSVDEQQAFQLKEEIARIYSTLASQAWKRGLKLRIQSDGQLPETMHLPRKWFRQSLIHLVEGMISTAERGEIIVNFVIDHSDGAALPSSFLKVTVSGVLAESGTRNSLKREDEADSENAILESIPWLLAKHFIQTTGSHLEISRSANGQTSLHYRIPLGDISSLKRIEGFTEADLGPEWKSALENPERPLAGLRVLIAEDMPENRLLLSRVLQKLGALVDVAENGLEAVQRAQAKSFDFILMDIQMPVLDGLQAALELQRKGCRVPLIALTARSASQTRSQCLSAGYVDYLTKPIDVSSILDTLQRHTAPKKLA